MPSLFKNTPLDSLQRSNGVILFTVPYYDFSASGISAVLHCALPVLHEGVPVQRVSEHCPPCALQRGLRSSQADAACLPLPFRLHKIRSVGMGGISADDDLAVEKLTKKLEGLEFQQATMKAVNAYSQPHCQRRYCHSPE